MIDIKQIGNIEPEFKLNKVYYFKPTKKGLHKYIFKCIDIDPLVKFKILEPKINYHVNGYLFELWFYRNDRITNYNVYELTDNDYKSIKI